MKIAITGAGGFIGSELVKRALTTNHELYPISRASNPEFAGSDNVNYIESNLAKEVFPIDRMADCDLLVHLFAVVNGDKEQQVATTIEVTQKVLKFASDSGVKRLVHVSSLAVLDYESVDPGATIDESVPLNRSEDGLGSYAIAKTRQERLVYDWARSNPQCETVILRPGLVYSDSHLLDAHAGFVKKGVGIVALHSGQVPLVSLEGCANGIIRAFEAKIASPEIVNLVDEDCPLLSEYLERLQKLGNLGPHLKLPWEKYQFLGKFVSSLLGNLGAGEKIPDGFLKGSIHARLKPLHYSSCKAKEILDL